MPNVVAETEAILVLNKPSGLIAHSDGRTIEPSVAEWLFEHYPALREVGEPWISPQGEHIAVAGIVHRLDRGTSGIMLVAKTPEMYAYLKGEFKARRVEKTYLAYVHGHMEEENGAIIAEIMRSIEPPRRWYARPCEEGDKRAAITEWKLLKKMEGASYIEARPKTGRTHQIRVHFSSIGHPLLSDALYGGHSFLGFTRPALHASSISSTLPSGERTTFAAPLPPDFPLGPARQSEEM